MSEHKNTLRTQLKAQRRGLADAEVTSLSRKIIKQVFGLIDWPKIDSLHTYLPLHEQREVDTQMLLSLIWQKYPYIKTATWAKTGNSYASMWIRSDGSRIPTNVDQQFSVIIVPLLGFNDSCHRLGFGGGHYDRFLPTQPEATAVGLCYEFGHVTALRPEAHDIPLTSIVTDVNAYHTYDM